MSEVKPNNGQGLLWNQLNWSKIKSDVDSLQRRIFRASSECRWRTLKSLQHLLIRSRSAKLFVVKQFLKKKADKLIIKKTTDTNNKNITTDTDKFASLLYELLSGINCRDFQPQNMRIHYLPKDKKGKRIIGSSSFRDTLFQSLLLLALEPEWEAKFSPYSFGFRKQKNTVQAIQEVEQVCQLFHKRNNGEGANTLWILKGDVKKFYESIRIDDILPYFHTFREPIEKFLRCEKTFKDKVVKIEKIIPGSVFTGLISNIILSGLEQQFEAEESANKKLKVIRYADDFLIISPSKKIIEWHVLPKIKSFLERFGLELNETKTALYKATDGFDYLGYQLKWSEDHKATLLISPDDSSVERFLDELEEILINLKEPLPMKGRVYLERRILSWLRHYAKISNDSARMSLITNKIHSLLNSYLSIIYNRVKLLPYSSKTYFMRWKQQFDQIKKIIGGDSNLNKGCITRSFELKGDFKSYKNVRFYLFQATILKKEYINILYNHFKKAYTLKKDFSFDDLAGYGSIGAHKLYKQLQLSQIRTSYEQKHGQVLKERVRRTAFYDVFALFKNWIISLKFYYDLLPLICKEIVNRKNFVRNWLLKKAIPYNFLKHCKKKLGSNCFSESEYLSVFLIENWVRHIRNLFIENYPFPNGNLPKNFTDKIKKEVDKKLRLIRSNLYILEKIPRVKQHSLNLMIKALYKEHYRKKIIEIRLKPYKSFEFHLIPQNKDNYNNYPWEYAMNPLIHLEGDRLKLKVPFEPHLDSWEKKPDIVMGIDLGIIDWATLSIWDFSAKDDSKEIGRYFIDDNVLSNKKFAEGHFIYQNKVAAGVKKSSMKQKLCNLRLTEIKKLQRLKKKREKLLKRRGIKEIFEDYKYRQYSKLLSQCWTKVHRINRQIVQKIQHIIMEIAEYHHVGMINVENLRWVRPKQRKKSGAFLSFYQVHWLHSQIQRALQENSKLHHVTFNRINAKNTSQKCSKCGNMGERPAIDRNTNQKTYKLFYCPDCNLTLDADLNAARNIAFATR